MTMPDVLTFAKEWMERVLENGDTAVDATAGTGRDTLHLARCVGNSGSVFSFDIQAEALEQTKQRLEKHHLQERVFLLNTGHEHAAGQLPDEHRRNLKAAVFNLGYLPGGDKTVTTRTDTTIQAVSQLLNIIKPGGLLFVVVYPGHKEGRVEKDRLEDYAASLPQKEIQVLRYEFMNQVNHPPFLFIFEKR
ncbi:class I SAM-dependent methyltransferase [Salibacterium halotolerans]|uniref:Putative rRNA methylase n=1 Tax=Salibacterium halotolerans TaxID=1884432 RepID=A0A1I5R500_9BACI|nr:class I SAM-dependent methyltransferase [Salibacterium halotolerans]SFP53407.1 Putative rRNA methylase [Salibacterium halotolerans]